MDNIKQTFSIDATQALATIAQLDKEFQRLASALNGVASQMGKVNSVTKQADKLGAAFKSNIPQAVEHTERLTTSLGLLSRVVFTQAIVRGLNVLRNTLEDTAKSAVDFQKQVALTTTIADGAKFDEIAGAVRRLSDEFNIPLLQSAAGVYQALSNQVGDFGDSVRFSEEAARFAKATNSSLKDSVDLLSGALASYGLTVQDTDKVSSIFFATIDKGRVNASELANSFGRIGPIAAELGVSLEETGGALAAISVKGSKTAETLTQFRAILSALQKPSEAMEERLAELGFTSSELAIKTLGLSGLLDTLAKSTGGSAEQMAKLFPNIRGLPARPA
jgi:TP901 family phage tail tape measure protein